MTHYKIVETDNYSGDYPSESFLNIPNSPNKDNMQEIADVINKHFCHSRYWKVVENDYKLKPGFEP